MVPPRPWSFVHEYWLDAMQRWILTLDILRERGNIYFEHKAEAVPNVLQFKAELVRDGRTLPRPVNYFLVRIVPPEGVTINPLKRPFIVVDPRAGHGPGIGGMKADSEIGEALKAGHPCYYIGFLPTPVPGQTVEDVFQAEAVFVQDVARLHPASEGKPAIIANCQAGWQIMMMAALHPELSGPIMLAGSPLSYWAGVRGKNPMRYLGGLLGGSWLTALTGDVGNGLFDGAHLVANFESLDPANTHWDKIYNVYSKADTEACRFLDFETWWGSPVLLNAGEMQWIADNLFIGNKLSAGEIKTSDGKPIDLRKIRSPIIVFCSWGDNITPPQQALDWITDIYASDQEIVTNEQTIVYTLHQSIGHLGIFVSGKVAAKEHREFTECMNLIDLAPPGLYEAVITEVDENTPGVELTNGKYVFRLEARKLEDIRKLGANSAEDDQRFAAVAHLSKQNVARYRAYAAPFVRALTTQWSADMMRRLHPNRLRFAMVSNQNPFLRPVEMAAKIVRENRLSVSPDNPLLAVEKNMSSLISACWEAWGNIRDTMMESVFLTVYGSPVIQAMAGDTAPPKANPLKQLDLLENRARLLSDLEQRFEKGGVDEAECRALVYISRPEGIIDERGFNILKKLREVQPEQARRSIGEFKEMLKEQAFLVRLDEKRAMEAIPKLLPANMQQRQHALDEILQVVEARGALSEEKRRRLDQVADLFVGKGA
jgi:hypothetical protein